jgi:hypothetical protein
MELNRPPPSATSVDVDFGADEIFETTDLPPEFAAIAANVKKNASSVANGKRSADTSSGAKVKLKVRWNPHPEDTGNHPAARPFSWGFVMKRVRCLID